MARLLTNDEFQATLDRHYIQHYGVNNNDFWYPAPAANVRVFARGKDLITLKCHVLTGVVTEAVEQLSK